MKSKCVENFKKVSGEQDLGHKEEAATKASVENEQTFMALLR